MPALLDVNALIALVDIDHVDHAAMQKWFTKHQRFGWATCPFTENGMVRVLSQAAYPSGRRTPAEVIQTLAALKGAFSGSHRFWPDDVSITDESLFDGALLVGSRQVTDVYLRGLASQRKGALVSFDRRLAWQAVFEFLRSFLIGRNLSPADAEYLPFTRGAGRGGCSIFNHGLAPLTVLGLLIGADATAVAAEAGYHQSIGH